MDYHALAVIATLSFFAVACGGNALSGDTASVADQPDAAQDTFVEPDSMSDTVLTVEFAGPEATQVEQGESDALFLAITLKSTADLEIQNMPLHLQAINGMIFEQGQYFHNIRLTNLVNQKVACGPMETPFMLGPNGENQDLVTDFPVSCGQAIKIQKGQPLMLGVVADVSSEHAPPVGNVYRAMLGAFKDGDVRYADTGLPLPTKLIQPNAPINGNAMVIKPSDG